MKNIKKALAVVLCAVIALSTAACGKKENTVTFDRAISIYTLAGPTLAGKIADLTGSYTPALLMCGGYLAVAFVLMLLLPKKNK